MLNTRLESSRNAIDSGRLVSFIQKSNLIGFGTTNSIPCSGDRYSRCDSPQARASRVAATSRLRVVPLTSTSTDGNGIGQATTFDLYIIANTVSTADNTFG